jgi:predicted nucleotidyltransferase
MNSEIQKVLTELRCRFESIYGVRMVQMILFGSYARNEATPESDIDVMVVLRGSVKPGEEINRISESRAELSLKSDIREGVAV